MRGVKRSTFTRFDFPHKNDLERELFKYYREINLDLNGLRNR